MKQFLKENWFKIIITLTILLIGFSIFYYFVIFIPQKEQTKLEQERQRQLDATKQGQLDTVKQEGLKLQLFDAPSLLGESYVEIKSILGTPTDESKDWQKDDRLDMPHYASWDKQDIDLYIEFKDQYELIKYIFIGNNGVKYSAGELMKFSGANKPNGIYKVSPVKAINASGITGIYICKADFNGTDYLLEVKPCE